jgi:hypothetical protein
MASFAAAGAWVAANAGTIAAVGAVAGAGMTAYESHEQGVAASNMAKAKARVEADRAAGEQITSRQNMLRALASENAGTLGAVGTGTGTGFGANARRQISQGQNDLLMSKANASAQISLLDQQSSNDLATGNVGAVGDILGGISSAAKNYRGGGPPPAAGGSGQ